VYRVYKVDSSPNLVELNGGAGTVYGALGTDTQWSCLRVVGYSGTAWISTGP
jgi:hypothetical protein